MDNQSKPRKTVTVIEPVKQPQEQSFTGKRLRVAAYCRVSTDSEEQLTSYTMQKRVYTEMIAANPEWVLAGIYADEGISGTRIKNRKEFQRMIDDCFKGKIDYIITKSVSRFARNTADCIEYVRQLKLRGIGVIFEEQNCDTLKCDSELLLTIHAGFAQAESESMSRNITWSVRKRFENGTVPFQYRQMLGYRKGPDGNPEIVPEEAEIIRNIFNLFLSGHTLRQIADTLNAEGVQSKRKTAAWNVSSVRNILQNEKYCGDAILQKTVTIDCISKTKKKNTGEAPMYYVSNNHPAIVSKEVFHQAQAELARRTGLKASNVKLAPTGQGRYSRYALSQLIYCAECGARYRRVVYNRKTERKIVWRCGNRLDYNTKYCRHSPTLLEDGMKECILHAINQCNVNDHSRFKAAIESSIGEALGLKDENAEIRLLEQRVDALNDQLMHLLDNGMVSGADVESQDEIFQSLSSEIAAVTDRIQALRNQQMDLARFVSQYESVQPILSNSEAFPIEWDENLIRQLVRRIRVYQDGIIEIEFVGGCVVRETVPISKRKTNY